MIANTSGFYIRKYTVDFGYTSCIISYYKHSPTLLVVPHMCVCLRRGQTDLTTFVFAFVLSITTCIRFTLKLELLYFHFNSDAPITPPQCLYFYLCGFVIMWLHCSTYSRATPHSDGWCTVHNMAEDWADGRCTMSKLNYVILTYCR